MIGTFIILVIIFVFGRVAWKFSGVLFTGKGILTVLGLLFLLGIIYYLILSSLNVHH